MTKDQVSCLAMSLGFHYDDSKNEVKDLDKLVRLVNHALDQERHREMREQIGSKS